MGLSQNSNLGTWQILRRNRKMSSSKPTLSSLFMAAIFFFFLVCSHTLAIRPIPASSPSPPSFAVSPHEGLEVKRLMNNAEENCEGSEEEEECLMRRTLAAHLDYIYTQKQNP